MLRTLFDLLLLAATTVLLVIGVLTYPTVPTGVLAGLLVAGLLLLAPVGRRSNAQDKVTA